MIHPCHIGVDFGTSGCRAMAIDRDGVVISSARRALPASVRDGRTATQRPEDWWAALRGCFADLVPRLHGRPVAGIAVDGTSASLLLADRDGRPLTPAHMYDDASFGDAAERIGKIAPENSPARGATSALAKYLGLAERIAKPDFVALHQADWIVGRLTGIWNVSDENNALKLGYDVRDRCWPDWLNRIGVKPETLPQVVPAGQPIASVSDAAAAELGLSTDTCVVSGTTDSIAGFIATGANRLGDAVTSLGTTLVVKVLSGRPIDDARFGIYSHRLGEHWLVGGASNCGGATLLQFFTTDEMRRLSETIDPEDDSGLDYYPLPGTGERFPIADPMLAPRLTPRPDDDACFLQGLLEGLARVEAKGYILLETLGAPRPKRVLTIGGGAANTAWSRIRERVVGLPVTAARQTEAAYGAALLAQNAAGCGHKERQPSAQDIR
ncbi:MAG: carbohydrate kinase [Gammaproteobacteria bacterium]|nr:carbohydrate kinase [Gammaproteobacteria bacterium]